MSTEPTASRSSTFESLIAQLDAALTKASQMEYAWQELKKAYAELLRKRGPEAVALAKLEEAEIWHAWGLDPMNTTEETRTKWIAFRHNRLLELREEIHRASVTQIVEPNAGSLNGGGNDHE